MHRPEHLSPLYILIPVYNDWPAASAMLRAIDEMARAADLRARVFLVDDGSTQPMSDHLAGAPAAILSVELLRLKRNLGHQRALCAALAYLHANRPISVVLVMDGDGEDAPSDIPVLLETAAHFGNAKIVFAARAKRAEGVIFKICYRLFQSVHQLLLGFGTNIGNFSVIPFPLLDRLVAVPELWNHYAAAVVKAKLPYTKVPVARAKRLAGQSQMGFVGLVIHGLSAISVFSDIVAARLLIWAFALTGLAGAGIMVLALLSFAGAVTIPGWAAVGAGLLLLLLLQSVLLAMIFAFQVMYGRSGALFIPARDGPYFWGDVVMLYELEPDAG